MDNTSPTYANLVSKNDRAVRSTCCDARIQLTLKTSNTIAGCQIVYSCNKCARLYVAREQDEPNVS